MLNHELILYRYNLLTILRQYVLARAHTAAAEAMGTELEAHKKDYTEYTMLLEAQRMRT